ncbi:MAG: ribonuclease P [Citrobacter freundii]|nr:MAG: ribonuclease P [Citrobacter freundii]
MKKSLNKKERLKSRKEIELLFKEGQRLNVSLWRVFFVLKKEEELSKDAVRLQFGVGASSRFFKRAVDRNRIKRLGREAWRLQKQVVYEMLEQQNIGLNVFFIYTGRELPDYDQVYTATADAIQKLMTRIK